MMLFRISNSLMKFSNSFYMRFWVCWFNFSDMSSEKFNLMNSPVEETVRKSDAISLMHQLHSGNSEMALYCQSLWHLSVMSGM